MRKEALHYKTVLLFSGKNNTPNVLGDGLNYKSSYDQYLVCGYWKYPNGKSRYCYGGVNEDGNFIKCE